MYLRTAFNNDYKAMLKESEDSVTTHIDPFVTFYVQVFHSCVFDILEEIYLSCSQKIKMSDDHMIEICNLNTCSLNYTNFRRKVSFNIRVDSTQCSALSYKVYSKIAKIYPGTLYIADM